MLYPLELRALNGLRRTDLRLYVKLHAIGLALLLLGSDLRRLGKLLLVFYQAIYRQIAVAVIHNVVAPIDRICFSPHDRHSGFSDRPRHDLVAVLRIGTGHESEGQASPLPSSLVPKPI
jgi:hypothetical protein